MRKIKLLLSAVLLLHVSLQSAVAQEPKNSMKKGEKMESENILSDEDSFYGLKIEGEYAAIVITVNGMEIFKRLRRNKFTTFMPVNPYVYSGKNKIEVKLFSGQEKIAQITHCKVSLVLINKKYKVNQAFSVIAFDNNVSKEKLKGSTPQGQRNGIVNVYSPMAVGETTFVEGIWDRGTKTGAKLTQTVTFATPFPRWKFLDSEPILGEPIQKFDEKAYEKSKKLPKIEALYAIHHQIIEAIRNKKVKELMPLFKERNEEMDRAFGDPLGTTGKELFYALNKSANDPTLEVLEYNHPLYLVEDNDKVAYIVKSLVFNKKDKSGSESYTFKFRYEKGEWIVTR